MPSKTSDGWQSSRKALAAFLFGVCISASSYAIWALMIAETGDQIAALAAPVLVDGFILFGTLQAISGTQRPSRTLGWVVLVGFVGLSLAANWVHMTANDAHLLAKLIGSMFPLGFLIIEAFWRLDNDPAVAAAERARERERRRVEREERDRRPASHPAKPAPAAATNGHHPSTPASANAATTNGDSADGDSRRGRKPAVDDAALVELARRYLADGGEVDHDNGKDGLAAFIAERIAGRSERTISRYARRARDLIRDDAPADAVG